MAARIWWMLRAVGSITRRCSTAARNGWRRAGGWTVEGDDPGHQPFPALRLDRSEGRSVGVWANRRCAPPSLGDARAAEDLRGAGHIAARECRPQGCSIHPSLCLRKIAKHFDAVGADKGKRIVTYCGRHRRRRRHCCSPCSATTTSGSTTTPSSGRRKKAHGDQRKLRAVRPATIPPPPSHRSGRGTHRPRP